MQNEIFRKIVSTYEYTLPQTEQYPSNDRILTNSNSLLIPGHQYFYPSAIGVKTGFTTQAKNCLIAASNKDNLELISVVLHAEATEDGRGARYIDTINLLDYGNNNYSSHYILKKGDIVKSVDIKNASNETKHLNIIAKDSLLLTLPKSKNLNISYSNISINENLSAPIEKDSIIGQANYVIDNISYKIDLIAANNVEEKTSIDYFNLIYILLILILIKIALLLIKKKSKNNKLYLNP